MKNFEKLWQELVSEFPEILEDSNEMKSFVKNFIKTKPEIKISKNFKKALEEKIKFEIEILKKNETLLSQSKQKNNFQWLKYAGFAFGGIIFGIILQPIFAPNGSNKNLEKVIASITGLIRGYVLPSSQCKRTSPLLIEDFVDQLGNGNFEQFGQAGERDSSSFFSKTTFGDTEYLSYGSISIEQLQFISLDNKFDRAAMVIEKGQGENVAQLVQDFIKSLNPKLSPEARFHENYVRNGTIFEEGENGILLNQDAVNILVDTTIQKIKELSIRQAKSYMYVDKVEVDYNDSSKMMRIKRDPSQINPQPKSDYAIYFYAK